LIACGSHDASHSFRNMYAQRIIARALQTIRTNDHRSSWREINGLVQLGKIVIDNGGGEATNAGEKQRVVKVDKKTEFMRACSCRARCWLCSIFLDLGQETGVYVPSQLSVEILLEGVATNNSQITLCAHVSLHYAMNLELHRPS